MKQNLQILLFLVSLALSQNVLPNPIPIIEPLPRPIGPLINIFCFIKCSKIISKVCGKNGITYTNSCFALCAGTKVAYKGICADCTKPCPNVFVPVCGVDNLTHKNPCTLKCVDHVALKFNGYCPKGIPCPCPPGAPPVCAVDNQWHEGGSCVVQCYGRLMLQDPSFCGPAPPGPWNNFTA